MKNKPQVKELAIKLRRRWVPPKIKAVKSARTIAAEVLEKLRKEK